MKRDNFKHWHDEETREDIRAARLYSSLKDGIVLMVLTKQAQFLSKASSDVFKSRFPDWEVTSKEA